MPKGWVDLKLSGRKLISAPEGYTTRAAARVKQWIQHCADVAPSLLAEADAAASEEKVRSAAQIL